MWSPVAFFVLVLDEMKEGGKVSSFVISLFVFLRRSGTGSLSILQVEGEGEGESWSAGRFICFRRTGTVGLSKLKVEGEGESSDLFVCCRR